MTQDDKFCFRVHKMTNVYNKLKTQNWVNNIGLANHSTKHTTIC